MAYRTRIKGVGNLTRQLRKLPDEAQSEVKDVLAEAARMVQRDAVALVPVDTGNLKKVLASPRAVRIRRKGLQVVFGVTGVKAARDGYYARFVEFGTKGYKPGQKRRAGRAKALGPVKLSKSGKVLGRKRTSGPVRFQRVHRNIPARPAQPFMRPAFAKNLPVIRQKIKLAVSRALKRSAR